MLSIIDLKRNQELPASDMSNVAGGTDCDFGATIAYTAWACAAVMDVLGQGQTANSMRAWGTGVEDGACGK